MTRVAPLALAILAVLAQSADAGGKRGNARHRPIVKVCCVNHAPAFLHEVELRRTLPFHPNGQLLPEIDARLRSGRPDYRAELCAMVPRVQQRDCLQAGQ